MNRQLILAIALAAEAFGCHAQNDPHISGTSDEELSRFVHSLRSAISSNDAQQVASLVSFPVPVHLASGKRVTLARASFLKEFASILTPCVKAAVLQQDLATIFANSNGWMFGNGELWASGICRDKSCLVVDLRVTSVSPYAGNQRPNPSVKGTSCAKTQAAPYVER